MENKNVVVDKLVPVGFRVLVNVSKKPTETSSGFILPETENQGIPVMAQIAMLGKKSWLQKLQIVFGLKPRYRVGQTVYYRRYSVDELIIENQGEKLTLYILEENEIIGIVN